MQLPWVGRAMLGGLVLVSLWQCSSDAVPPSPPDNPTQSTNVATFAVDQLFFGDEWRDGGSSNTAWGAFGYDLDGKTTSRDSTDVCTLAANARRLIQEDSPNGVDNSFGSAVVPIIELFITPGAFGACLMQPYCTPPPILSLTEVETTAIRAGAFTLQIQTTGLDLTRQQTAMGLTAQVFASDVATQLPPAFDTTTDWPVLADSLNDPSSIASGAKALFAHAYVVNGTFVAGTNEVVTVPLHAVIGGAALTLPIHSAIVTFDVASSTQAANGVIAGVVDTNELVAFLRSFLGAQSESFCGSASNGIMNQLRQAQDILLDRSNRPGVACNAVSIGLGFTAKVVANPTTIATAAPPPDKCDAGTD